MKASVLLLILLQVGSLPVLARENSVIYLRMTDAIDLDPWQAQEVYSSEIDCNIFEGLVRFSKSSVAVEPCLAVSWKIAEDGRRWQFILRQGVRFHDGTPFDARAVQDMFQSRLENKQGHFKGLSSLFSYISATRIMGPYAVEITLKRPYAPFLVALADSTAFIVSPSARKSGAFQPIGTGPFRFLSWARGKSMVLVRNPDYWGGAPRLEKIIFKVMADSPGRVVQIKNGSADMAKIQSSREYDELSRRDDIAILSQAVNSMHYLGFNTRKPPFDRKEVRAAFLHIIDKEGLIKRVFQNMATPAYSPLPPALFPEMKFQPASSFKLEVARILLKQAGLANGFSCTLYLPAGQEGLDEVADILAVMAGKVKVAIRKRKLPFNLLMDAVDRGEHDLLLLGWSTAPDPDFFLCPLFSAFPGNRNRFFYNNPGLTSLLDRGRITTDARQRATIYLEALAILKKDVPWIPLYHPLNITACNKRVSGLAFTPLGQTVFREAAKAAR